MSKAQIQAFLGRCYDGDPSYSDPEKMLKWEGEAYLVEQLLRVRREVEALDDTAEYGLVSPCW